MEQPGEEEAGAMERVFQAGVMTRGGVDDGTARYCSLFHPLLSQTEPPTPNNS